MLAVNMLTQLLLFQWSCVIADLTLSKAVSMTARSLKMEMMTSAQVCISKSQMMMAKKKNARMR